MLGNQFVFSRERRRFGRQCIFSDRNETMLSIQPSARMRLSYILRNPVHRGTQLSDQKAADTIETENVTMTEHGMFHFEGGWPREVNLNDEEATLRYRKKIERDDNWGIQVNDLIHKAIIKADQNSAVNIYEDFFIDLPLPADGLRMPFEARQVNIFRDPLMPNRPIGTIDWIMTEPAHFLALYTRLRPDEPAPVMKEDHPNEGAPLPPPVGSENSFYIWDQKNPLRPLLVFEAPELVRKALICPKDDNFAAGGLQSGKVNLWDAHSGGNPLNVCPLEAAHREAVPALCWVHSKSNSEFYTGSSDGSVKYWDGRDMREPLQQLLLDPEPDGEEQSWERAHGATVLEFEYTIPIRYIVTSDHGHIFIGNRKGATPTEALLSNYKLMAGPIRTVERNPFFVKNFLIVGDWCAKIWGEEFKNCPSTFLVRKKNQLLCGTWSTARCSLFVTGDARGEVDFWDLLLHQLKPIYTIKLKQPVVYLKFRHDGEILIVGLLSGDVQMFEMDDGFVHSTSKEKALIAAIFERELVRCKLLEARVEEIKLRKKTREAEEEANKLVVIDPMNELDTLMQDPETTDSELYMRILELDKEFKDTTRIFKTTVYKVGSKRLDRQFVMERTEFELDYDELGEEEEVLNSDAELSTQEPRNL